MFINYGFKSVTMDDIAEKLGISKKTIYTHFSTKSKLIQSTSNYILDSLSSGIDQIKAKEENPIIENYEIKKFANNHLKGEKTSPHYQLQKYYPKVYSLLKDRQFELLESCVVSNLQRGVELGYYRDNINIPFVTRIHYVGMLGIKDPEIFSLDEYSQERSMEYLLEYHLRAICTPKGIKLLEEFLLKYDKENH